MGKKIKENDLDVNDLLGLPRIEELILQPEPQKEVQILSDNSPTKAKENSDVPKSNGQTSCDNSRCKTNTENEGEASPSNSDTWMRFIENTRKYIQRRTNHSPYNYRMEEDIVITLKSLNIENLNVSQLINCILRSFIEQHAKELRKLRRKRGRSMLDND